MEASTGRWAPWPNGQGWFPLDGQEGHWEPRVQCIGSRGQGCWLVGDPVSSRRMGEGARSTAVWGWEGYGAIPESWSSAAFVVQPVGGEGHGKGRGVQPRAGSCAAETAEPHKSPQSARSRWVPDLFYKKWDLFCLLTFILSLLQLFLTVSVTLTLNRWLH